MSAHFRRTQRVRFSLEKLEDRDVPSSCELLENGGFEAGNTDFTSAYIHSPDSILDVATYAIVDDPTSVQPYATSFGDHTTGSGLMMAVNGATSADYTVWEQTVSVLPNARHDFSGWAASWYSLNPAQLQFLINGVVIGSASVPLAAGEWQQFSATWNSEAATTARIQIIETSLAFSGNDFALDDLSFRDCPADIHIQSAQLQSGNTVQFTYTVTGDPVPFQVGLYRSADATFDSSDVLIGDLTSVTPSSGSSIGVVVLETEIAIDPSREYVLVVGDPNQLIAESDEANNDDGHFRKLALSVVTHGYERSGKAPSWLFQMASQLRELGYHAIAFDWASLSDDLQRGRAVLAGHRMAERIRSTAALLASEANDVIDLHLIGHDRGAVVISRALLGLQNGDPGPEALQLGYYQMTMLDPHPARNRGTLARGLTELQNGTGISTVGWFAFNPSIRLARAAAVTTLTMQMSTNDPKVVIPANVDYSESYWQQRRSTLVNLWGLRPAMIVNRSSGPFVPYYLAPALGINHTLVPLWYLDNVL